MRLPERGLPLALIVLSLGLAPAALADDAQRAAGGANQAADPSENEDWLQQPSAPSETWDPLEPANRGVFKFNDTVDVYAVAPIARGWRAITPEVVRRAVHHFFVNLRFPVRLLGLLTQGRLVDSTEEIGRFLVNSSVGIAGLFDPASSLGLEGHEADLGQSLGRAGLGPGPYLVLPLYGASSARDLINLPLDLVLPDVLPGLFVLRAINTRAELSEEIRQAKQASLDYYAFLRSAYLQQRDALIREPESQGAPLTIRSPAAAP